MKRQQESRMKQCKVESNKDALDRIFMIKKSKYLALIGVNKVGVKFNLEILK